VAIDFWVTVCFYVLVAALAVGRARRVGFQPVWTQGNPRRIGVVGGATGLVAAVVVLGFSWVTTGDMSGDARVNLMVSEGTLLRVAAAVLVTMVLAPLIEELLFRGLVVESLRSRGAVPAVVVGAALFSAWHLNQLALFYYFLMGALLGYLYWRWGLKASIAAHVSFNGAIVALAILAAVGPAHTVAANGVSASVPAAWHERSPDRVKGAADLALEGPSGSGLIVTHEEVPGASASAPPDEVASFLNAGTPVGLEQDVSVEKSTARVVEGPGWRGVRVSVRVRDSKGEVVVIPKGDRFYQLLMDSGASARATSDLDYILRNLSLPWRT
jgi:membrane protease YdiL (CAAX protease family)